MDPNVVQSRWTRRLATIVGAALLLAGCAPAERPGVTSDRPADSIVEPPPHGYGGIVVDVGAELLPMSQQSDEMGGYSLIIGMRVTSPGKWIRGGYRIEFSQNGQTYANEVVAQITICTPDAVDAEGECSMKVPDD